MREFSKKLHAVLFEDASRAFDIGLISCILMSVTCVVLESVAWIKDDFLVELDVTEWFFTIAFSFEYICRLWIARQFSHKYALSFWGVVDVISILPSYFEIFIPGAQFFLVVRVLRVMRVFRVLKLGHYSHEANLLLTGLSESRKRVFIFLCSTVALIIVFSAIMYLIEGDDAGFDSLPASAYWTCVTITTVGYGDISPVTFLGRVVASFIMILGYGIIAVPSLTAEVRKLVHRRSLASICPKCHTGGHDLQARFCKNCGTSMSPLSASAEEDQEQEKEIKGHQPLLAVVTSDSPVPEEAEG